MNRKQYIKKMQALVLAIYKHPESKFDPSHKVGDALRHIKLASNQVENGGYKAAWNSEAILWARKHYGM